MRKRSTYKVKEKSPLQKYSDVYVKKKKIIIPWMEQAMGEKVPDDAKHGELVALYIHLLKNDPEFSAKVSNLVNDSLNAVDPITAIGDAISGVAGVFQSRQEGKNIQAAAEAEQEALLYKTILERQKDNDSKNIILITGLSLVAVGGIIFVIIRSRR